jgi:prophage regulatory protein
MGDRLLSDSEVSEKVSLSRTQRWRLERAGRFPARIKIGDPDSRGGRVAWSEGEINEWITDRMAARKTLSTARSD